MIGIFPVILLIWQNRLLSIQNDKIETQTKIFNKQSDLFSLQNEQIRYQNTQIKSQTEYFKSQNSLFEKQNDKIDVQTRLFENQNDLLSFQNEKVGIQTDLFKSQNELLETQNSTISKQTYLAEASRRSSQMFIMGEVLSAINLELIDPNNKKDTLTNTLVGRAVSLSRAMKPYKYLQDDKMTEKALSPERGQFLISLIESRIDSAFFENRIIRNSDFSSANLQGAFINNANLGKINLITPLELYRRKNDISHFFKFPCHSNDANDMFYSRLRDLLGKRSVPRLFFSILLLQLRCIGARQRS